MAYAYLDEITATRSLQWDDGTVIEYSYFKDLEAAEEAAMAHNDPTLALIEQWEQQIANDNSKEFLFSILIIIITIIIIFIHDTNRNTKRTIVESRF